MALILILHVLIIGILLNRIPFRFWTVLGLFAYFAGFYLVFGHTLAAHPDMITPPLTLEDDYYRNQRTQKKSPFDPLPSEVIPKSEAEIMETEEGLEESRIRRLKSQQIQTEQDDQPRTNP